MANEKSFAESLIESVITKAPLYANNAKTSKQKKAAASKKAVK